ncbi:MAG: septal ring lytic transglycosylase RlpA family protein [Coleofasciculaceae cyanobacterium]
MPFFGLAWATSWFGFFLSYNQGFSKLPDYLISAFPSQVFSIVNSPIELPSILSTSLASVVWSSESSIITLPNLAWSMNVGLSRYQSIQAFTHPSVPLEAVENPFCYQPSLKQKKDALQVAASSNLWKETSSISQPKKSFSQQVWQVVQNLLPWHQRPEAAEESLALSVKVVSTHGNIVGQQTPEKGLVKPGFWQYAQGLKKQSLGVAEKEVFQVWLKSHLIGQFPQQEQAELMAQRLKQSLKSLSKQALKSVSIEATLAQGIPALKIGDRLLFTADDKLGTALNHNPELITIEWANNLRLALGKTAIPLAEAQSRMHRLVKTAKTFQGRASWYGTTFHGKQTATGETYDKHELTAAHPTLPFNTYLKVKNRKNGHSVIVKVNDRGPYVADRNLDLSQEAARCLNSEKAGIVPFEAVIMQPSSAQKNRLVSQN